MKSFFLFSALLQAVVAVGHSKKYIIHAKHIKHTKHESRHAFPNGWSKRDAPLNKNRATLPLRINLRQGNLHRAEELLMGVADPDSSTYGKHYTPDQIVDLFSPGADSVESVREWLHGAFDVSRVKYDKAKGGFLVNVTIAEAEDLLRAEYDTYEHVSGSKHIACKSYSIPQSIRGHIDFVTPTLHFDTPTLGKRGVSNAHPVQEGVGKSIGRPSNSPVDPKTTGRFSQLFKELGNCSVQITPVCLEALYNFSPYTQLASKRNSFGIVEYTPQSYIPSDLDVFAHDFAHTAVGYRPILASIDGGEIIEGDPDFYLNGESNLDLQYAIALTYPTPVTLYQVGDNVEGASFNNFLDGIDASYCTYGGGNDLVQDGIYPDTAPGGYKGPESCGKFHATNVVSTSYGYDEVSLTPLYEQRQCYEYMKLGLQGVTMVFSSGDFGVAGNSGECLDTAGTVFSPAFPASCPYVTVIGATQILPNNTVFDQESACLDIYSGGGFSNVFPMAAYQKTAVASYFQHHMPSYSAAQYNNSQFTRGYPDISVNGASYAIALGGEYTGVSGTSAATPVAGSIFTLINDARITIGKKPIGFVNPVLYKNAKAFNDIIRGGNPGCGTPGFQAVDGWDPVTGLGTPNFPKLLAVFLALP